MIMGDADDSYDFSRLDGFLGSCVKAIDLVMGNRFKGGIVPGAMPPLHRYLGNPVLSLRSAGCSSAARCGDFHCGLRGFRPGGVLRLGSAAPGMEFASEMVVKATLRSCGSPKCPQRCRRTAAPAAAPAHLARRLAASALPAALQPALAVLPAGPRPGHGRHRRRCHHRGRAAHHRRCDV